MLTAASNRLSHGPSWLAWSTSWQPPGAKSAFIKWTGWIHNYYTVNTAIYDIVVGHWKENWRSAQVVNFSLVDDPTIRQPGFNLPRQHWSLLNRFRTVQGHCGVCKKLWNQAVTDLCPCSEKHTLSTLCPLMKLNGGLSQLHSADDESIAWLTNYGSWCIRKKKKIGIVRSTPLSPPNNAWQYAAWPNLRSRSRSRALEGRKFGHFQRLSPPPFTMEAGKWPCILQLGHNT